MTILYILAFLIAFAPDAPINNSTTEPALLDDQQTGTTLTLERE